MEPTEENITPASSTIQRSASKEVGVLQNTGLPLVFPPPLLSCAIAFALGLELGLRFGLGLDI